MFPAGSKETDFTPWYSPEAATLVRLAQSAVPSGPTLAKNALGISGSAGPTVMPPPKSIESMKLPATRTSPAASTAIAEGKAPPGPAAKLFWKTTLPAAS